MQPNFSNPDPGAKLADPTPRSLAMMQIARQIHQIGTAHIILIEGELGAGKQFLSRKIHGLDSARHERTGECVVEDASLIFGTDWLSNDAGIVRATSAASGGTLVLRGVEELDVHAQARLLHFIRSLENESADFAVTPLRIICTSRRPLRSTALAGKFLPELYYRLSAVVLHLPALADRKEDIPGLARHFVYVFSQECGKSVRGFGPGTLEVLLRHRWPGNVRELESVVRAACFSTDGEWIRPTDLVILPYQSAQREAQTALPSEDLSLQGTIQRHIRSVLRMCTGNKAQAAARLGISRSTLYRMLNTGDRRMLYPSD